MSSTIYNVNFENFIINPEADITEMCLTALPNGEPAMRVRYDNSDKTFNVYYFPLRNSSDAHFANAYLLTLNTGLEIEFQSFTQYGNLIKGCFELYKASKSKEIQELLKIIGNQSIPLQKICDHLNIIRLSNNDGVGAMAILNAYLYGVISGKRAERAKKKKATA